MPKERFNDYVRIGRNTTKHKHIYQCRHCGDIKERVKMCTSKRCHACHPYKHHVEANYHLIRQNGTRLSAPACAKLLGVSSSRAHFLKSNGRLRRRMEAFLNETLTEEWTNEKRV